VNNGLAGPNLDAKAPKNRGKAGPAEGVCYLDSGKSAMFTLFSGAAGAELPTAEDGVLPG